MKNNRLLIIADDADVSQTLSDMAESIGFEVINTDSKLSFFAQLALFEPGVIVIDSLASSQDSLVLMEQLADINDKAQLLIVSELSDDGLKVVVKHANDQRLRILGILQKPLPLARIRQFLTLYLSVDQRNSIAPDNWQQQFDSNKWMPTQDDLIEVIEKDLLTLNYQPKLDCRTGNLIGFEALARWEVPGKGIVTPDVFVPLAESSHLMSVLTCNIAKRGLYWLSKTQNSKTLSNCSLQAEYASEKLTLSLNLSGRCVEDADMPDKLSEICHQFDVDPANIFLEISESTVMQDPDGLLEILMRFRDRRFQLSIDDFGTGYSSMLHLVRLPFTEIKIDKNFVGIADASKEARSVIKCIIDLAKSLGIRSVAEGVESQSVRQYLTELGCDAFQGFLISKPVNEDNLLAWSREYCESLH
jgi:EAL domain-containing protein (putative c-di-GMP-specific phosphodiesterase class I)